MALEDTLHDGLDAQQALAQRVREIVERITPEIRTIMAEANTAEDGLRAIAAMVADELTDITTEAVQAGRKMAHSITGGA